MLTDHSTANNIDYRRRHVDVFIHHVVATNRRNIIRHTLPLPPNLLSNHPNATIRILSIVFRRIMSNHELQPLHCLQPRFEVRAGLDDVEHIRIIKSLGSQGGIIGHGIEEGRGSEVRQHWSNGQRAMAR